MTDKKTPDNTSAENKGAAKTSADESPIARRHFLLGAGTAVAAGLAPAAPRQRRPTAGVAECSVRGRARTAAHAHRDRARFLRGRCGRCRSFRPTSFRPRAATAASRSFIDRQLAGAYGSGARLYRDGPFPKGKPELGYSAGADAARVLPRRHHSRQRMDRKTYGKDFDRLSAPERETALKTMEEGKAPFPASRSAMFFNALLQITMEGFFADPIYGGNRNMASWKMIGYPGLPATYREEIKTYFGKKYDKPPHSIADFS